MSVNHMRMKRISRSLTSSRTSFLVRPVLMARERYFLSPPLPLPPAVSSGAVRFPLDLLNRLGARTAMTVAAVLLCACGASSAQPASGSGAGSGAAAGVPCGPADGQTLAASRSGRVYGCAHGSARRYLLGSNSCRPAGPAIAPVAVAARLAAYGSSRCAVDTGTAEVVFRRLGDGTVLDRESATTARLRPESYVRVTALVLASDGAFAWISSAHSVIGG